MREDVGQVVNLVPQVELAHDHRPDVVSDSETFQEGEHGLELAVVGIVEPCLDGNAVVHLEGKRLVGGSARGGGSELCLFKTGVLG